jgi:hypothetical protein
MAKVRRGLQQLLRSPRSALRGKAMICAHIEGLTLPKERR